MAQYIKDNGEWKKIGGVEKYPADFGTRAEFEAKKDDLPVGTVFTTTDEFEEGGGVQTFANGTVFVMDIGKIRFVQLFNYDALKPTELESIIGIPKHKVSVFGTLAYGGSYYNGYIVYNSIYGIGYYTPGNPTSTIANGTTVYGQFFFERA